MHYPTPLGKPVPILSLGRRRVGGFPEAAFQTRRVRIPNFMLIPLGRLSSGHVQRVTCGIPACEPGTKIFKIKYQLQSVFGRLQRVPVFIPQNHIVSQEFHRHRFLQSSSRRPGRGDYNPSHTLHLIRCDHLKGCGSIFATQLNGPSGPMSGFPT